jgi:hypothetical protein
MQFGNAFQGKKCARCRQPIQSDPAFDEQLWFHRACLNDGTRALQRAQDLAARYSCGLAETAAQRDHHSKKRQ